MSEITQLELFKFDSCPFCQLVMNHIELKGIEVQYRDILDDPAQRERLIKDTGRKTVPCLYINNHPMFESRDIIQWIDQNIDKIKKK